MTDSTAPKGPRRFGPYIIIERIGDGGMAEIFLAKMQGYSGFEKLVAVKKILPRYSENPSFASMLIHEAKLAARIQHFNVVQVLDLGEIDKQVYIAMEYVRGRDLAALLSNTYRRKEKMPVELSLFVSTELLTGLDYAHRLQSEDGRPLGLIHRDISPQNVLISFEGEVKVTDFGIARVIAASDGFQLPGNLHGKFGYMSPEQVLGKSLDQRSDVFSAGVVLHEMLTGQRLFRGKNPQATVEMILKNKVAPPSEINESVPPDVDRICLKALSKEREERYQTVGAFLGEVSRASDAQPRRAARRDLAVYMRRQFGALATRQTARNAQGASQVSAYSPTAGTRMPIGEILVSQGSLTIGELEIGLAEQRARGGRIGEVLLETGVISEADLVLALSKQSKLPLMTNEELLERQLSPELLQRFPREIAEATLMVPIGLSEDQRRVTLAVEDPFDQRGVLEARVVLGVDGIDVHLASKSALGELINRWYPRSGAPAAGTSGYRPILIADGDEDLANELANRIREEEFEVFVATDGKEAREICRSRDPAVVFLDASLPKIDGYNVLLDLRSRGSDAAAYVTSARADDFRQAKALELGADDFLVKPLSIEVTASKIRREMQKRKQGQRGLTTPTSMNGVSGSLSDMSLIDIVQSLELGRKSAEVMVQYEDGRTGQVDVLKGDATHCGAGGRTGDDAFYWLARAGDGLFRIEYKQPTSSRNIKSPNTFLILEALRRLDEEDMLAEGGKLPPPQTNPPPTPDLLGFEQQLTDPPDAPAPERPTLFQVQPEPQAAPAPAAPPRPQVAARAVTPVPVPRAQTPAPAFPQPRSLNWPNLTPTPMPGTPGPTPSPYSMPPTTDLTLDPPAHAPMSPGPSWPGQHHMSYPPPGQYPPSSGHAYPPPRHHQAPPPHHQAPPPPAYPHYPLPPIHPGVGGVPQPPPQAPPQPPQQTPPRRYDSQEWMATTVFPDSVRQTHDDPDPRVVQPQAPQQTSGQGATPAPERAPQGPEAPPAPDPIIDPVTGRPLARVALRRVPTELEDAPSEAPTSIGMPPQGWGNGQK